MLKVAYDKQLTAILVIVPYNDFISEGGKILDRLKGVAEANNCVPNMLQVLNAARKAELRVFYALHHRYRPGDYETWKHGIHQLIIIGLGDFLDFNGKVVLITGAINYGNTSNYSTNEGSRTEAFCGDGDSSSTTSLYS